MERISRREFVGRTIGSVVIGAGALEAAAAKPPKATDLVTLGKTGVRLTRLGMGTGTVGGGKQSNQTRLGKEKLTALFRHAYERGIRFFDLADLYGSHPYFRDALKGMPREKMTILSKIWWRGSPGADKDFDRFRKELDTDYIDILLLHCTTEAGWPEKLAKEMEFLERAKEKKWIRAHGISCHGFPPLERAASTPWVEVMLARINHAQNRMDGPPEKVAAVLKKMHGAGKGVIGMKILGEGDLKGQKDASLKFVLGLGCVDAMTIGFEKPEEIDDIIERINKVLAVA